MPTSRKSALPLLPTSNSSSAKKAGEGRPLARQKLKGELEAVTRLPEAIHETFLLVRKFKKTVPCASNIVCVASAPANPYRCAFGVNGWGVVVLDFSKTSPRKVCIRGMQGMPVWHVAMNFDGSSVVVGMTAKTTTSKMVVVEAAPADTLASVKAKLKKILEIPPDQQRLQHRGGAELEDNRTLSDVLSSHGDVVEQRSLDLTVRSRSGIQIVVKIKYAAKSGSESGRESVGEYVFGLMLSNEGASMCAPATLKTSKRSSLTSIPNTSDNLWWTAVCVVVCVLRVYALLS